MNGMFILSIRGDIEITKRSFKNHDALLTNVRMPVWMVSALRDCIST